MTGWGEKEPDPSTSSRRGVCRIVEVEALVPALAAEVVDAREAERFRKEGIEEMRW